MIKLKALMAKRYCEGKQISEEHEDREVYDCEYLVVSPKQRKHLKSLTTCVSFQGSDDQ